MTHTGTGIIKAHFIDGDETYDLEFVLHKESDQYHPSASGGGTRVIGRTRIIIKSPPPKLYDAYALTLDIGGPACFEIRYKQSGKIDGEEGYEFTLIPRTQLPR